MSDTERDEILAELAFLSGILRSSRDPEADSPPLPPAQPPSARERLQWRLDYWGYDEGWPCWADEECRLRHVLLALHQMGGPVWSLQEEHGHAVWRMGCSGHVAPSDALDDAIYEWFDAYMKWSTDDHINPRMNPDLPVDALNRTGAELAERWRRELGAGWIVAYEPVARMLP